MNEGVIPGASSWGARLLGVGERTLVLASASPRRADLLRSLGVRYSVLPVDLDETPRSGEPAKDTAVRLAREKALAARDRGAAGDLVMGADTVVVIGDEVLGKPADDADAARMLRRLSGRTHRVITGLALVRTGDGSVFSDAETTAVTFRPLEEDEIAWLVASGESRDKAGAYGIQGLGSLAVREIEGDYWNVVGLPLGLLKKLLGKATAT